VNDFERGKNMEEQVYSLSPGVNLTALRTDRFHKGFFSVDLLRALSREDASRNALLMSVLRRGTRALPDMEKLSEAMEKLYGASVEPMMRQLGETLSIGFRAVFPDGRYIPGEEDILSQVIGLTGELLLDPATHGGLLRDEYVRSEGRNLHDRVEAEINNKRGYAIERMRELMFDGEPYGVYPLGDAEEALRIRNQALTRFYREALVASPIEMYYCGSAEGDRVADVVRRAFRGLPGGGERRLPELGKKAGGEELRHVTEEMDVEQGNLVIGFRRHRSGDAGYPALAVFNELFGGGPASRLFLNVREKRSLCYYAGSSVDRYKEVMLVQAGIGFDRREETEEAVFAELADLSAGNIDPGELDTARKGVANGYLSALDSPGAICAFRMGQGLLGAGGDLRQFAGAALQVTAGDVGRVAAEFRPELSYFLRRGASE